MIKPLRKRSANLPSKLSKAARQKRARIIQELRDKATLPKSGRTLKISDTASGSGKIRFALPTRAPARGSKCAHPENPKLSHMSLQTLAERFPYSAGSIFGLANKELSTFRGRANSLVAVPRDDREAGLRRRHDSPVSLPNSDTKSEMTQILDLLALTARAKRDIQNHNDLEPYIRGGLSPRAMRNVRRFLKLSPADLASLLGISSRRCRLLVASRRPLDLAISDRLYRLSIVVAEATATFGSGRNAALWLCTPNLALNADAPVARLSTEIGTLRVRELITAIELGHFV